MAVDAGQNGDDKQAEGHVPGAVKLLKGAAEQSAGAQPWGGLSCTPEPDPSSGARSPWEALPQEHILSCVRPPTSGKFGTHLGHSVLQAFQTVHGTHTGVRDLRRQTTSWISITCQVCDLEQVSPCDSVLLYY